MRHLHLYKISNTFNSKVYIGVTFNPIRRWKTHQYESSTCTKLKRALAKYGVDNFTFEVICTGTEKYILELEKRAIEAYDSISNGYNTIPGGNRAGLTMPDSVKQKISASLNSYYAENESANKGRVIEQRADDYPVCVSGFWFPNLRTAVKTLGRNIKTIRRWLSEDTAHLEVQPRSTKIRPKRNSENDILNRSSSMKGKNAGEANGMYGKENLSRARAVIIEGIFYESIARAVRCTDYTKSQIEKRLKRNANGFSYASTN